VPMEGAVVGRSCSAYAEVAERTSTT
jgi:hypothetical protein